MNTCDVILRIQGLTGREEQQIETGKARKTPRVWAGVGGMWVEVEEGVPWV